MAGGCRRPRSRACVRPERGVARMGCVRSTPRFLRPCSACRSHLSEALVQRHTRAALGSLALGSAGGVVPCEWPLAGRPAYLFGALIIGPIVLIIALLLPWRRVP
jgi:hypothetical protein